MSGTRTLRDARRLETGVLCCLRILSTDGLNRGEHEGALREFLQQVRIWVPRYVRARFAEQLRNWADQDIGDLIEDAIQHLVIAVCRRDQSARPLTDETAAAAWCKRVIANFVISDMRRRARASTLLPAKLELESMETALDARSAFTEFVFLLRSEVNAVAPGAQQRLRLFDDFVRSIFAIDPGSTDRRAGNRLAQRRSRGRRLAREAWRRVKQRGPVGLDQREMAHALGLSLQLSVTYPRSSTAQRSAHRRA